MGMRGRRFNSYPPRPFYLFGGNTAIASTSTKRRGALVVARQWWCWPAVPPCSHNSPAPRGTPRYSCRYRLTDGVGQELVIPSHDPSRISRLRPVWRKLLVMGMRGRRFNSYPPRPFYLFGGNTAIASTSTKRRGALVVARQWWCWPAVPPCSHNSPAPRGTPRYSCRYRLTDGVGQESVIPSHDPSRISRLRPVWRKLPSLRGSSPRVRGFADFYQRFFR